MLYLAETHAVIGEHEKTFEDALKEAYLEAVPTDAGTRLLWYMDSTHGSGEGYKVVTITGFTDLSAYGRYVERVCDGDLAPWLRHVDTLRYEVRGRLLAAAWQGPGLPVDPAAVPVDGAEHPTAVMRWDVLTPRAGVDLAVAARERVAAAAADAPGLLRLDSAFVPALGAVEDGALLVLYRLPDLDAWVDAWDRGDADWAGSIGPLPGTAARESRLLRTSTWSPLA